MHFTTSHGFRIQDGDAVVRTVFSVVARCVLMKAVQNLVPWGVLLVS